MNDLLLTYYGDDFTGSTDVMEALTLGGVPTVLFLDTPTPDFIAEHFPNVRAVGVAGVSRSMTPTQMDAELPPKFAALKAMNAPIFHYKICSTFDSSPLIGSIGHAAEIGRTLFQPRWIPLIVGSPSLKRYVAFGHLFARVGDITYRLDRHPTMSKHPVTPMHESDLRIHLGQQTARSIGIVDVLTLDDGDEACEQRVQQLVSEEQDIILFDTVNASHLKIVGRLLWKQAGEGQSFVVGSSGVENALAAHWQSVGIAMPLPPLQPPPPVSQLVVMSGSASPVTAGQIEWALEHGFVGLRLNTARLINPETRDAEQDCIIAQALDLLSAGRSLVMYSALGSDDPAVRATRAEIDRLGIAPENIGGLLGARQGVILRAILEKTGLRRVCVAGGDTSGHAALQLGIYALEIRMPIAPGAPLCHASSHHAAFDGMEISLKGGQNGGADYFEAIRRGCA
jgi:3-oxoisoapionate kinase